jgi:hypothetical protein
MRPDDIPAPAARSWIVTIAGLRACEYARETLHVIDASAEQLHAVIGERADALGFVHFDILHTVAAALAGRVH